MLPLVAIAGGSVVTTNDPTPTIAGTSDLAPGAVVRVRVDSHSLTALVQSSGGTWNVTPPALVDGTRTVTASVTDPAGNDNTDSQLLTVDTAAPAVTITGGPSALTDDATPAISGTADVAAGTSVTVTLADETLTAPVQSSGAWSVTAAALSDGPHRVVMSVSDAALNAASVTQTLTVDTVAPVIAITGGASARTTDAHPTISGTSDAAPGTIVTVSIAGQTITTLLQANRTWNATPAVVGAGTWPIVASAPDPAGNVGSATQTLTIAADIGAIDAAAKATIARSGGQRVKGSSLSIGTKVTAPASGRIVATANGTVKINGVKRAIKLTSATARIAAGRSATLTLKPKGTKKASTAAFEKIRTAAKRGRRVTATITIEIVDAANHTRSVKRTVKLTPTK